jgi:hypothetical protein
VPKEFRGIGIRIEDDVLVTEDGHEVLSRDVPKDIDAIERLMAQPAARPRAEGGDRPASQSRPGSAVAVAGPLDGTPAPQEV